MQSFKAPYHISPRFQRTLAWAGLWAAWAGAIIAGERGGRFRLARVFDRPVRAAIAHIAHVVACSLLLAAAARIARLPRWQRRLYGPRLRRGGMTRAILGSALRRKLRGASNAERIAAISRVLRDPEGVIDDLLRRLERGFSRDIHPGRTRAASTHIHRIARPRTPVADTS